MSVHQSIPIHLTFGRSREFSCEIDSSRVAVFHPGPRSCFDVGEVARKSLATPLEMPTLDQALVPDDNIVIALDHGTPGAEHLVAAVWEYFEKREIDPAKVSILRPAQIGGGNQVDPRSLLPMAVRDLVRLSTHDPTAEESCAYLATTSTGERIYLARELVDADFVLPIGVAGFDSLLGYRGTHSVLYPGLSNIEAISKTVGQGHLELSPKEQRPLRQLVDEIAWLMGIQFVIQVVHAADGGVLDVLAGGAEVVFQRCCALLDDHWMISMPERVDTVVVGVPIDVSGHGWSQVSAAMAVARQLVEPNGRIVVLTELAENPGDGLQMIAQCEEPLDAIQPLRKKAPSDLMTATRIANTASWARVYLYSQLPDEIVEGLFMFPLEHLSEIDRILAASESSAFVGAGQNAFGLVD